MFVSVNGDSYIVKFDFHFVTNGRCTRFDYIIEFNKGLNGELMDTLIENVTVRENSFQFGESTYYFPTYPRTIVISMGHALRNFREITNGALQMHTAVSFVAVKGHGERIFGTMHFFQLIIPKLRVFIPDPHPSPYQTNHVSFAFEYDRNH